MPGPAACRRCGATLSGFATEGFCSACILEAAIGPAPASGNMEVPAPQQQQRFGDYELIEEIARGGMGVVFKARQISLGRIVALKMILTGRLASEVEVHRFRDEARAAAALHHPNIVAIHEVGEIDGQPFFSMDLVEGRNFAEAVREGPFAPARAAACVQAVAEAIHYAHEHGILHRDLKPSNVLIDAEGRPRVTDFGLAKRIVAGEVSRLTSSGSAMRNASAIDQNLLTSAVTDGLTLSGQVLGSPNFMPPEQARGKRGEVGPASDVYSLGALLYHLLTGRPPFLADSVPATLRLVAETEPVSPRLLNPAVSLDLETICLKCLEKDPQRRYGSAQTLAEDLDRFQRDEPILARPIGSTAKLWRKCQRKPILAGLVTSTVLLLLVVLVGSPIAAFRINRERVRAEQNAAKSQQVAQFLTDILPDVERSVRSGQPILMATQLDENVERLGNDLKDQPDVEAVFRQRVGDVYLGLGEYAKAEMMFRNALTLHRKLFGNEHPSVAVSLNALAAALYHQQGKDKAAEAEALLREALAIQKKLLGDNDPHVARFQIDLADVLVKQNKYGEAAAVCFEGIAMARQTAGNVLPRWEVRLFELADILYRQRSYEASEPLFRELLASVRTRFSAEHDDVLGPTASLARMLSDWAWEDVTNHKRSPPTTNIDLLRAGKARTPYERARESEALLHECLAIRMRGASSNHWRTSELKSRLGGAQVSVAISDPALNAESRKTKLAEAETLLLEGNLRLQQSNSADRKYKRDALERLARLYEAWEVFAPNTGKSSQAQEWTRRLDAFRADGGDGLEQYKGRTTEESPAKE